MITLPSTAISSYERLRAEVLSGQAASEGLAAMAYHGMVRGLTVLLAELPAAVSTAPQAPASHVGSLDGELLRVVANMVLQSQAQRQHVY